MRIGEGYKNATINRELAALKRMLRLVKAHPMPDIVMLKENNVRQGFFETEQFEAVIKRLPDYLVPVIRCAYITGWRVESEIRTRQWRHVDLRAGWLRIDSDETKGGDGREFPLIAPLREVLEERWKFHKKVGSPWVFPNPEGKQIGMGKFREHWKEACERAGQDGKILHDFRRTAIRTLERAGIPRTTAMKMVGHKTESVYRRYAIVDAKDLEEAGKKLELVLVNS